MSKKLEFASEELKNNEEVVRAVVEEKERTTIEELRNNEEVIRKVVEQAEKEMGEE